MAIPRQAGPASQHVKIEASSKQNLFQGIFFYPKRGIERDLITAHKGMQETMKYNKTLKRKKNLTRKNFVWLEGVLFHWKNWTQEILFSMYANFSWLCSFCHFTHNDKNLKWVINVLYSLWSSTSNTE